MKKHTISFVIFVVGLVGLLVLSAFVFIPKNSTAEASFRIRMPLPRSSQRRRKKPFRSVLRTATMKGSPYFLARVMAQFPSVNRV